MCHDVAKQLKLQGLFELYKEKVQDEKYLHIGDIRFMMESVLDWRELIIFLSQVELDFSEKLDLQSVLTMRRHWKNV